MNIITSITEIKLKVGDSFYEVFKFSDTVNKLTVTEIYDTLNEGTFYNCIKEDNTFENVQYYMFTLRIKGGYYFLNYEDGVTEYNKRIDLEIKSLEKKLNKLEAKKIKI